MMMRIKNVSYISDYKLKLLFSDEKTKIVDFEDWINEGGAYILPLKDVQYFKKVQMDEFNYTICWPNGADFCPDVLYEIGKDIQEKIKSIKPPIKHRKQSTVKKIQIKSKATAMTKNPLKKAKS